MERDWQSLIILAVIFTLSFVGAIVLFSVLESYAEVVNPSYRLGGAAAGFVVFFGILFAAFSRLAARPASEVVRQARKAITKPKGFIEYSLPESGYSIYYPKNWEIAEEKVYPSVQFQSEEDYPLAFMAIDTSKADKDLIRDFLEKDASQFADVLALGLPDMFKDLKILERGTMAFHGIQCPMFIVEKPYLKHQMRMMYIVFLDVKGEKMHFIQAGSTPQEFEQLKPLYEKVISTFQIINK